MKKIVLLSLALFSVAALRADGPVDWAQYGRYELQNAVLDRPVEVVFMGNSITDSWIRVDPDFFERNGFLDRGISGQTTVHMLARFRSDVIDLKPQVVVILAGINDIARNNGPHRTRKRLRQHRLDVRSGPLQRDQGGALFVAALRPLLVAARNGACR